MTRKPQQQQHTNIHTNVIRELLPNHHSPIPASIPTPIPTLIPTTPKNVTELRAGNQPNKRPKSHPVTDKLNPLHIFPISSEPYPISLISYQMIEKLQGEDLEANSLGKV
jgi:hypothetical protein